MRDPALDLLFEPLHMPNMTVKNRFFMAPMGTRFDLQQSADYYVARAKAGVGLITTGEICVHESGRLGPETEFHLFDDEDIGPLSKLVRAVKAADAKIIAQLNHAGRYTPGRLLGMQSVAPSAIASRFTGETPRDLSTEEVDDLVIAFAEAARRAREAGCDGVEIMGSTGYLVSQFLSPLTNKRRDKYGGDNIGRGTFLFSILQEIRKRVGNDFNVCVKFDAEDKMDGGRVLEDAVEIAPHIVAAGADRLHVWAGWHEANRPMLTASVPRGAFSHFAGAIKRVVDVPVAAVGRINDPYVAADILRQKDADLIGLGRPLLCDPEFVVKAEQGRSDEIRRCMACCRCFDRIRTDPVQCSLNPELGSEGDVPIRPTSKKRRVAVIGAGPAGLETARVAALRGHQVTLFDEKDTLGGMIHLAHIPPHKKELKNSIAYYARQMEILGVDLRLGESFSEERLMALRPDAVVMATGAKELIPDIPGIDGSHVVTASDALCECVEIGEKVAVIGGGLVGIETAEFLADRGRNVTVIEMLKSVASDVGPASRWGLIKRIREKMKIHASAMVVAIKPGSIVVEKSDGGKEEIPADTVVVAAGMCPRSELRNSLEQSGSEFRMIGSCKKPGQIAEAVAEGFEVGCRL